MNENLYTALAKAMETVENPAMKGTGNYGRYVLLSDLANAVRKPFAAQGLAFHHDIEADDERVAVTCIITHASGEEMRVGPVWSARGSNVQHLMGATTYLRRLTLQAATGLAGEEDDDGQNHADQVKHNATQSGSRAVRAEARASEKQIAYLAQLMRSAGTNEAVLSDFAKEKFGWELPTDGLAHLSATHASDLIDAMTKRAKADGAKVTRSKPTAPPEDDPWQAPLVDPITGEVAQ